ncbi:MAG: hypothetical protein GX464_15320 [Holophagae bacterium]|nr:hypothetical protein [Holophagae bacterium]
MPRHRYLTDTLIPSPSSHIVLAVRKEIPIHRSLRRIVDRKGTRMKRENHFIVVGNTALAINTWRELARRGHAVTRILRRMAQEGEPTDVDLVVGDPGDLDVLRQAGDEDLEDLEIQRGKVKSK